MFESRITRMLEIEYPIVGGTMMWISDADFVAAISNAGGLGVLASAMCRSEEELAVAVDRVFELTRKPFAVNINLFPSLKPVDNHAYADVLVEKGVKIVETSGHSAPADLCEKFKKAGMIWIHKCVGVRYALKVQELGADIVTVVGYENGGATGKLDIGTLVLVPTVRDAVDIPIIGGGGVSDGRGLLAVLALGAEAAIIGTRLLATRECPIHENLKRALVNATELDTTLIMRSINATHRVWRNASAENCEEMEAREAGFEELLSVIAGDNTKRMYDGGEVDAGIIACGQGIGLCRDIPSVKTVLDGMITQAKEIHGGMVVN